VNTFVTSPCLKLKSLWHESAWGEEKGYKNKQKTNNFCKSWLVEVCMEAICSWWGKEGVKLLGKSRNCRRWWWIMATYYKCNKWKIKSLHFKPYKVKRFYPLYDSQLIVGSRILKFETFNFGLWNPVSSQYFISILKFCQFSKNKLSCIVILVLTTIIVHNYTLTIQTFLIVEYIK